MNHEAPWVVVIPGGQWLERLVRCLSPLYRVAVVNPFETEATIIADKWIKSDILKVDDYIQEVIGLNPAFVITDQCDVAIEPLAKINKALGHPAHAEEVINKFRDKFEMYKAACDLGLPMPESRVARTPEEIDAAVAAMGLPLIIKPVDSNASQGCLFLQTPGVIDYDWAFSKSNRGAVVVQRLIAGRMFTVDGLLIDGKHYSLTLAERTCRDLGVIDRVDYTADVPEALRTEAHRITDEYVNASGAEFGITHTEFLYDGDLYMMETAIRGGGIGTSSHVVPHVSGIDPYQYMIAHFRGEKIAPPPAPLRRAATIKLYEFPKGIVEEIRDDVLGTPNVALWKLWIKNGDRLGDVRNVKDLHAVAVVLGETQAEVKQTLETVQRRINVKVRT